MTRSTYQLAAAALLIVSMLLSLTALGVAAVLTPPPSERWSEAGLLSDLIPGNPPIPVVVMGVQRDHWVRFPAEQIGRAFVWRLADSGAVVALRGDHSEYHVPIRFSATRGLFESCCWMSEFDLAGRELPPRWRDEDLQVLPVMLDGNQVYVDFSEPVRRQR